MKRLARTIVVAILGWQVRRLRSQHTFKIVGVVGSIGKTSTKRAIAEVLDSHLRVQYQSGNYNDLASVPLVFFGQEMPALFNPFAWARIFISNERKLRRDYDYDVVVVEIGTDGPAQIAAFARYLALDIAVVTAIAPEHMEFFADLDAVAAEELSVITYAERVIINADLVHQKYLPAAEAVTTYSIRKAAPYRGKMGVFKKGTSPVVITKNNVAITDAPLPVFSEAQLYSCIAAATVWDVMGLPGDELESALRGISAVPGRMQLLEGIKQTTIVDDSYNASPEAAIAALDAIYKLSAPHKIVLLGNMNELGEYSKSAHTFVGDYCDPRQIDEVVTLGPDSNTYLAEAARKQGCKVTSFDSPYDAGEYIKSVITKDSLVLVKGSQNKVFAEEAIKTLLAHPEDSNRLVRQSDYWMNVKRSQFGAEA